MLGLMLDRLRVMPAFARKPRLAALQRADRQLPRTCLLCLAPAAADGLCRDCIADLPTLPDARCPLCATPLQRAGLCGECLVRAPRYDRLIAALLYQFPVDALVQRLKYAGDLAVALPLALALARAARSSRRPEVLVPLPLSPARLAQRGFNQAAELARIVARQLQIPLAVGACRRVRDTAPQAALPWKARHANIRDAFACDDTVAGLHVALIDDVATTGATLDEAAAALKRAGAREVEGWVVARTPRAQPI